LQPFGCTSYAHVSLDLNLSKLNPRSIKTALLGYFGCDSYKLLDKSTSAVFKSRDVIFEEGITHLAKQPAPAMFHDGNDLFIYEPLPNNSATNSDNNMNSDPISLPIQGITPRPLANHSLHKDSKNAQETFTNNNPTTTIEKEQDKELAENPADTPLALRRSQRTTKPST